MPDREVDIDVWEREVLMAAADTIALADAVERIDLGTPGSSAQRWQIAAE